MQFYGYFTGARICGDLVVEQPTDDQPDDFWLVRRQ
jgi:hypothetical protein